MTEEDLADLAGGEAFSEVVERAFSVERPPRLRVRNVSGETRITVGEDGAVRVRATKRVRGSSAEKAKRLLQSVDVRLEQQGDEISIDPQFREEDRAGGDLSRRGRVSVDLEVVVPRESRIDAHTVSGELSLEGTRGDAEVQSVSGEVRLEDVQGSLHLKTVSGDLACLRCAGAVEANTVSGDLTLRASRLRAANFVTVSGDVVVEGVLEPGAEHRVKTISGDIELVIDGGARIDYRTMSGDAVAVGSATVASDGKRDRTIVVGDGRTLVHVKTVSGDLRVSGAGVSVPPFSSQGEDPLFSSQGENPLQPPSAGGTRDPRAILERLARGEIDVEAATAALAGRPGEEGPREAPTRHPPEPPLAAGLQGRILRIQVLSGGKSKVNIAIPVGIARMGKTKLAASGLVRGHLAKFGIELDDVLRMIERPGPLVDISDNEDRVLIQVE